MDILTIIIIFWSIKVTKWNDNSRLDSTIGSYSNTGTLPAAFATGDAGVFDRDHHFENFEIHYSGGLVSKIYSYEEGSNTEVERSYTRNENGEIICVEEWLLDYSNGENRRNKSCVTTVIKCDGEAYVVSNELQPRGISVLSVSHVLRDDPTLIPALRPFSVMDVDEYSDNYLVSELEEVLADGKCIVPGENKINACLHLSNTKEEGKDYYFLADLPHNTVYFVVDGVTRNTRIVSKEEAELWMVDFRPDEYVNNPGHNSPMPGLRFSFPIEQVLVDELNRRIKYTVGPGNFRESPFTPIVDSLVERYFVDSGTDTALGIFDLIAIEEEERDNDRGTVMSLQVFRNRISEHIVKWKVICDKFNINLDPALVEEFRELVSADVYPEDLCGYMDFLHTKSHFSDPLVQEDHEDYLEESMSVMHNYYQFGQKILSISGTEGEGFVTYSVRNIVETTANDEIGIIIDSDGVTRIGNLMDTSSEVTIVNEPLVKVLGYWSRDEEDAINEFWGDDEDLIYEENWEDDDIIDDGDWEDDEDDEDMVSEAELEESKSISGNSFVLKKDGFYLIKIGDDEYLIDYDDNQEDIVSIMPV